jgi:poly(A) polymerase
MMVARICQLYPNATGSVIVNRFFHLLHDWPWPRPVLLKAIEDGPLQVRVWNPTVSRAELQYLTLYSHPQIYPGDKRHLMPIITPAYPSMCATHNITSSTQKIIVRELKRASLIANDIFDGKLQWRDLFQKQSFFVNGYKYYLSIVAASKTKEAQLIWSGLVESKVRRLVSGIEMSQAGVEIAHPFNKGFERVHSCKNEEEIDKVLQGSLEFHLTDIKTETTDQTNDPTHAAVAQGGGDDVKMPGLKTENGEAAKPTANQPVLIYTTTYYVGIELSPGTISRMVSPLSCTNF